MKMKTTKTKSKNSPKIDSLQSLRKRKAKVKRKLARCEAEIVENYYDLVQPFAAQNLASFAGGEYDELPASVSKVYKFVLNAKRLTEIVRMGRAIYLDYRR